MHIIRGLINLKPQHCRSVVTIGNFDGVHLGHQAILAAVSRKAKELGVPSMLICFEPQPREFFDVFNAPARLTRFREKVELLEQHGLDLVLCFKFDERTRSMTSDEFVRILGERIEVSALYVGDDFQFGHDRSGSFETLQAAGARYGFKVTDHHTLTHESERISSTRIRECLAQGDFGLAEALLGHPYMITGKVVRGRQIGQTIGVRTANIPLHRDRTAIIGVFAVELMLGVPIRGVANVGVRPTLEESTVEPILEVHLFDFDRDIYGSMVHVRFRKKIRDEIKFSGLEELKAAIQQDIRAAKDFFEAIGP